MFQQEQQKPFQPKPMINPAESLSSKMTQSHSLNEIKTPISRNVQPPHQIQEAKISPKLIEEPIIDTSKLQFKKKSIPCMSSGQSAFNSGTKQQERLFNSNKKSPSASKSSLIKSHSQNESLAVPQRNLISINPAANSGANSSGGIANMSFDDY